MILCLRRRLQHGARIIWCSALIIPGAYVAICTGRPTIPGESEAPAASASLDGSPRIIRPVRH
ncbi:hypothetical protein [Croceibacterium ferulae]|uniref:hypothetical protein n=1 Tax=Croceibacterium ferulae TaxID=1854641 RepID=UPI0011AE6293|nr:hypothetical protein [Croceibacterium ferulae]